MRVVICLIIIISRFSVFAQDDIYFSGTFENEKLTNVIVDIESETGLKFYYHPAWTDSLKFTGNFENTSIMKVLDELVNQT